MHIEKVNPKYDFEVIQIVRGKMKVISHHSSLIDADIFAHELNERTKEPVLVRRVDFTPISVFNAYPNRIYRHAGNK